MRKLGYILCSLLILLMSFASVGMAADTVLFSGVDYQPQKNIRVMINNRLIPFDVAPQSMDNRTLVPLRAIFEAVGLEVQWDENTGRIVGTNGQKRIEMTLGSKVAMVDGQQVILDVPPQKLANRTMIPLRFLADSLELNLVWNNQAKLILLANGVIEEWRYEGYEPVPPYREYERKYINGNKTEETRYNGKNHEIKRANRYDMYGRMLYNASSIDVAQADGVWKDKSYYAEKVYWMSIDAFISDEGTGIFHQGTKKQATLQELRQSSETGKYVKLKIVDQRPMEKWMNEAVGSYQSGEVIESYDTVFLVKVNDRYDMILPGAMLIQALVMEGFVDPPGYEYDGYGYYSYVMLTENPKKVFGFSDATWKKLSQGYIWTGMTKDMFLVAVHEQPDDINTYGGWYGVSEQWVYEGYNFDNDYYYFDQNRLSSWQN